MAEMYQDGFGPVRWTFGTPLARIYDAGTESEYELSTPERQEAVLTAFDRQLHVDRSHPNVMINHDGSPVCIGKLVTYRALTRDEVELRGATMRAYDRAVFFGVRLTEDNDRLYQQGKLRLWSPRIRFDSSDEVRRPYSAHILEHSAVGVPLFKHQVPADEMRAWDLSDTPILTAGDSMATKKNTPQGTNLAAGDGMIPEQQPPMTAEGGDDMGARLAALEATVAQLVQSMQGGQMTASDSGVTKADLQSLGSRLDMVAGETKKLRDEQRRTRVEAVIRNERLSMSADPEKRAAQVNDLIAADERNDGSFRRAVEGWAKVELRAADNRTAGVGATGEPRKFLELTGGEKVAAVRAELRQRELSEDHYTAVFAELKQTNPAIAAA